VFVDYVDIVPVVKGSGMCVVEFVVEKGSSPIFHCIFERCYCQNDYNGDSSKTRIGCSENRKYLHINNVLISLQGGRREVEYL